MAMTSASYYFLSLTVFLIILKFIMAKNMTIFPEKFEIRQDVIGCDKVEFVVKNVTEDFWCMLKCAKNETCKGVFSDPSTGHCVGCSQAGPSSENSDILNNGTYFERKPKHIMKSCDGSNWMKFQGFCYFFTQKQPGFQAALNECRRRGAGVAVIENEAENNFLREQAKAGAAFFYITGVVSDPDVLDGTWVKYNTTIPATFLPWYPGQPNNSPDWLRCVYLFSRSHYEWTDVNCYELKNNDVHMICKK